MKFKFKIHCPICGSPMFLRKDNDLVCVEREKHPKEGIVLRLIGDQDVVYELITVEEEK